MRPRSRPAVRQATRQSADRSARRARRMSDDAREGGGQHAGLPQRPAGVSGAWPMGGGPPTPPGTRPRRCGNGGSPRTPRNAARAVRHGARASPRGATHRPRHSPPAVRCPIRPPQGARRGAGGPGADAWPSCGAQVVAAPADDRTHTLRRHQAISHGGAPPSPPRASLRSWRKVAGLALQRKAACARCARRPVAACVFPPAPAPSPSSRARPERRAWRGGSACAPEEQTTHQPP